MPLLFYPYGGPAVLLPLLPGTTLTVAGLAARAVAIGRARRRRADTGMAISP